MRITQADTAKLLAIYLVIVSHCGISEASSLLYSFHVQVFFIISGFCYTQRECGLKEYLKNGLKKTFRRIYIPYVMLAFILGQPLSRFTLISILWGSDQLVSSATSSHLWFLPCFFASTVIFHILKILINKNWQIFLLMFVLAFVSSMLDFTSNIVLHGSTVTYHFTGCPQPSDHYDLYIGFPFDFNVALTGIVLMYIGNLLRMAYNKLSQLSLVNYKYLSVCLPLFLIIGYFLFKENLNYIPQGWSLPYTAMSWAVYGNYWLFISTSVTLCIALFFISCLIDNHYVSTLGRYTLPIYAFHPIIISTIMPMLGKCTFISELLPTWLFYMLISVSILFVCVILIPFVRRIDKTVIGE